MPHWKWLTEKLFLIYSISDCSYRETQEVKQRKEINNYYDITRKFLSSEISNQFVGNRLKTLPQGILGRWIRSQLQIGPQNNLDWSQIWSNCGNSESQIRRIRANVEWIVLCNVISWACRIIKLAKWLFAGKIFGHFFASTKFAYCIRLCTIQPWSSRYFVVWNKWWKTKTVVATKEFTANTFVLACSETRLRMIKLIEI